MATITAKDAFPGLDIRLPQDTPVAFLHPTFPSVLVYIGGEMPHWVRFFVNALDNSSSLKEKRDLTLCGKKMVLE